MRSEALRIAAACALCWASCRSVDGPRPDGSRPDGSRPDGPEIAPLAEAWWSPGEVIEAPRDLKALATSPEVWATSGTRVAMVVGEFLIDHDGRLGEMSAVSLEEGVERWRIGAPPATTGSQALLALGAGRVVLRTPGWLTAVDTAQGRIVWESGPWRHLGRPVEGGVEWAAQGDDLLVLMRLDGREDEGSGEALVSLSGVDGAVRWRRPCGAARCAILEVEPDAKVLIRKGESDLEVIDGAGAVEALGPSAVAFRRVAHLAPGRVALVSEGGGWRALRLDTGERLWSVEGEVGARSVVVGGALLLLGAGGLQAVDLESGRVRWSLPMSEDLLSRLPSSMSSWSALEGDHLLLPANALTPGMGALLLIEASSGRATLRSQIGRVEAILPSGDRALLLTGRRWSAARWRVAGPPLRAWEGIEEDVARSLAVAQADPAEAGLEGALTFPNVPLQASSWLRRLGPEVYAAPLAALWAGAEWPQIPALTPLVEGLPEPGRRAALIARLEMSYGLAPSVSVADARAAVLRALQGPSPDPARLSGAAVEWLEVHPRGIGGVPLDRLRALGLALGGGDREGLLAARALNASQAAAEALSVDPAVEGLLALRVAAAALGPAPVCPWPRLHPPSEPREVEAWIKAAACAPEAPPPGARFDPSVSWAIWRSDALDVTTDLWISRKVGERWSAPMLADVFNATTWPSSISASGDTLTLAWGQERAESVDWAGLSRDGDGDGWTDRLEARLGTRADRADTDGDGIPDPQDHNPTCAPAADRGDVEAAREALLWHLRAFEGSPQPLLMTEDDRPCVQAGGVSGPVITLPKARIEAMRRALGPGTMAVLQIADPLPVDLAELEGHKRGDPPLDDATAATIAYEIARGPFDVRPGRALLKKIGGRWRVTGSWPPAR